MNYELFMTAALGEARTAARRGERPEGAVAVLDEAMVARGQEEVVSSGDPTAHAVVMTVRRAAERLGRRSLAGVIVFSAVEPCAMCVGALLESDADGIVYAAADPEAGAVRSRLELADGSRLPRRLSVVSGILESDAAELRHGTPLRYRRPRPVRATS